MQGSRKPLSCILKVTKVTKKNQSAKLEKNLKMNTMDSNHINLYRDWSIVIFEWLVMSCFSNFHISNKMDMQQQYSFTIGKKMNIQQLFAIVRKKMIWGKTKRIILFLIYFKMTTFWQGCCDRTQHTPSVTPLIIRIQNCSHSFELRLNWIK